jgi:hypothetical protein
MPTSQTHRKRKPAGKRPVAAALKSNRAPKAGVAGAGTGKLLVSFRASDGLLGVTRGTVRRLAAELDLKETQVVHLALKRLAESVLPAYQPDEGPLSKQQLATIRRLAGRQDIRSISSTLL